MFFFLCEESKFDLGLDSARNFVSGMGANNYQRGAVYAVRVTRGLVTTACGAALFEPWTLRSDRDPPPPCTEQCHERLQYSTSFDQGL